ncbi:hypothetical protein O1611_g5150 [Lasiodiplodia mahajangana]|uniref:Uncharacterized protein n=1 Tax=Lasiodiplodia mahajangana TaxID=1108764 RepID=A0ACC2JMB6_9PEZI|nr:hypothetical protein O1611_g5150 [Lasiodiplodia mahajangana]
MPVIIQGAGLVDMLAAINTSLGLINTRLNELERRMDKLEATVGQLNNRVLAGESNALVRLENSRAKSVTVSSQPLYLPLTNEAIELFPATRTGLNKLSRQPTNGSAGEKQRRLKLACGIAKPLPDWQDGWSGGLLLKQPDMHFP